MKRWPSHGKIFKRIARLPWSGGFSARTWNRGRACISDATHPRERQLLRLDASGLDQLRHQLRLARKIFVKLFGCQRHGLAAECLPLLPHLRKLDDTDDLAIEN